MGNVVALCQDRPPRVHNLSYVETSESEVKGADVVIESTDHGVSPAFSDLVVLPSGCSADHKGLRIDCSASEENLPMSSPSPDRKGTRIRQHVCTSCPQNLCNFWKPDIVTSQKADCATNAHRRVSMRQWRIAHCSVTVIMAMLITGVDSRFPAGVSIGSWSLSPGTVVSDSMYLGPPGTSTSWLVTSIRYN